MRQFFPFCNQFHCLYYRFTPEAKQERSPFSYMPFGLGPRQCIGMRLALMQIKLAMVKLIQKFRFKDAGVSLHYTAVVLFNPSHFSRISNVLFYC